MDSIERGPGSRCSRATSAFRYISPLFPTSPWAARASRRMESFPGSAPTRRASADASHPPAASPRNTPSFNAANRIIARW